MPEPEVLLSGLGIPESPRWHQGRLWFANWIGQQIVAVRPDGTAEFLPTPVERLMGWSIDWLPDGRLLTTGDKLRRQEPDGSVVTVARQAANEIVVDARGNIYLNGARVAPGGQVLQHVELAENRAPFALALGGEDRRTLFILTAEWRIADGAAGNLPRLAGGARTGEILALPVDVPGAGRP